MLKKFILNSLSAFVGAWVAIILLVIGCIIFFVGILSSFRVDEGLNLKPHSVLKIVLGGEIKETENNNFDYTVLLNGSLEKSQTLRSLLTALELAEENSNIEAILIECSGAYASPATLDALRTGILNFKKSGKRVFAYGDYLTMGDFYVATAADSIYLNPAGSLDIQGLGGTSLYFKDLLDKIGIEVEAVKVGSFKSAVEPYISNEMSEPARMQLDSLYGEMWSYILKGITNERKVKASTVDSLVNKFIFLDDASKARKYRLVDNCLYFWEVETRIGDYVGSDAENINYIKPEALASTLVENRNGENQIAVLYAAGDIGEFEGAGINCHKIVPLIINLANDDNIKGMVLRVNSPGGSVFGSEQIGEALDYFKSKGKILAVSMGDYAASGGYWISAGADRIFADPLTITGSIGIFGLVPNINKLITNLGIHPQTVSTNPGVNFPSIFYPMTPEQHEALQKNVERGYDKFISRVSEGRNKKESYIKTIAEGRVWSAIQAQKLGLIDELGGLDKAIEWVEKKGEISNPNVVSYPAIETNFWSMLSSSIESDVHIKAVLEHMAEQSTDNKLIALARWLLHQNHIQARSPYYKITL